MATEIRIPVTPHVNHRLVALTHYLTAFVILTKGLIKLPYWPEYSAFVVLCMIAGPLILAITVFHHWLSHRIRHLDVVCYFIEAIVVGSIAYITYSNSPVQAIIFGLASLLFLASCFIRVWVKSRTSATFSEAGIKLWLSPLKRYTFAWGALQSVSLQPDLHLVTRKGRSLKAGMPPDAPLAQLQTLIDHNLITPKKPAATANHA